MTQTNPAVVIGGEYNALGVIRNLGRIGIPVYCFTSTPDDFAIYSRYCHGYDSAPNIEQDLSVLRDHLSRMAAQSSEVVYVHPTSDLSVLALAQLIDELPDCVAAIPCLSAAEILIKKKLFYKSLQDAGIPHPLTLFSEDENIEAISPKLPFPVFIKPSISQIFFQQFGVKGFIANDKTELQNHLNRAARYEIEVIVQEIVLGPDTSHYPIIGYIDQQSRPCLVMALQKLRQPTFFSVASAMKSIPRQCIEPLIQWTIPYLQTLGYQGLFGAEWKQDAKDGVSKLLEINARSCWFNTLQAVCGANHIVMAYRDALGDPITPIQTYEVGVHSKAFFMDIKAITAKLVRGRLAYRQVLQSYRGKQDWLVYARDDPLPFLHSLRLLVPHT
jgi:predicted ATP-grasp superfamily ATP-dependent carboligase